MDKAHWDKWMRDNESVDVTSLPEGTLEGPEEVKDAGVPALQWTHTRTDDTSQPVTIAIYRFDSGSEASKVYKQKKVNPWNKWPSGYPNNNDYEGIGGCGIATEASPGLAIWSQDVSHNTPINATFLVVLTGGAGGSTSFDDSMYSYPDSIYMRIYAACNNK